MNPAGTYLYVVAGTTSATLTEYALSSGAIGSATATLPLSVPGFTGDTIIPTGVTVLANGDAVYISAYDQSAYNPGGTTTSDANPGWLFGFAAGSGGALTPVTGSPYQAGVKPSALATDPVSRFVYVTDYASNELIGYTVRSTGELQFMVNGPFKTGNEPTSIVVDPRGIFIYLTNSLDENVTAYSIALPTGTPSADTGVSGEMVRSPPTLTRCRLSSSPRSAATYTPPIIWATPSPASDSIPVTEQSSKPRQRLTHRRQSDSPDCDSPWQPCPVTPQ